MTHERDHQRTSERSGRSRVSGVRPADGAMRRPRNRGLSLRRPKSDLSFLAAGIAVIAGLVLVLGIVVMTLIDSVAAVIVVVGIALGFVAEELVETFRRRGRR